MSIFKFGAKRSNPSIQDFQAQILFEYQHHKWLQLKSKVEQTVNSIHTYQDKNHKEENGNDSNKSNRSENLHESKNLNMAGENSRVNGASEESQNSNCKYQLNNSGKPCKLNRSNESGNLVYAAGLTLPEELYLWNNQKECLIAGNSPYDQGDTSECVAYSVCTMVEYQISKSLSNFQNVCLSKIHLYGWRSNYPDEGMEARDCIDIILKYGVLLESDFKTFKNQEERAWHLIHQIARGVNLSVSQNKELNSILEEIGQKSFFMAKDVDGKSLAGKTKLNNIDISPEMNESGQSSQSSQSSETYKEKIFRHLSYYFSYFNQDAAGSNCDETLNKNKCNAVDVDVSSITTSNQFSQGVPNLKSPTSEADCNSLENRVSLSESDHIKARLNSVLDIKRALFYNGPCPIILPVVNVHDSNGWFWYSESNDVDPNELGHCITIIGYSNKKQAFLVRNSWSSTWGPFGNGHAWMPYVHIDQHKFWEAWTVFINGKEHLHYIKDYYSSNNSECNDTIITAASSLVESTSSNIISGNEQNRKQKNQNPRRAKCLWNSLKSKLYQYSICF